MTPGAAGTAADQYRITTAHPFDPLPADYGARDLCRRCGGERREHPGLADVIGGRR